MDLSTCFKKVGLLRIANFKGKQVKNKEKYISSFKRILYKKQVLTHAKLFRNQTNLIKFTRDQPLSSIKKTCKDLGHRNAWVIKPCTSIIVRCTSYVKLWMMPKICSLLWKFFGQDSNIL